MIAKRTLVALVSAVVLGIAAAAAPASVAGSAVAPQQEDGAQGTIPYTAQLSDEQGKAIADGLYDFTFEVYETQAGGNPIWTETRADVAVTSGRLSVSLGNQARLPKAALESKQLWLAVSVRGPGETAYTALTPRQAISPDGPDAVSALTCPHNHFPDYWPGTSAAYGLNVTNNGTGDGIRAYTKSTAWDYAAIYAINNATTGAGTAVYANSSRGLGLYAYSGMDDAIEAHSNTTWASAVYAHSENGNGVWAVSTNKIAVFGATYTNTAASPAAKFLNRNTTVSVANTGVWAGSYFNHTFEGHDIDTNGNSTNRTFYVARWGDVRADGTYASPAADYAEILPATGDPGPGDVLVIGVDGKLVLSSKPFQTSVAGVHSTKPAFLGGAAEDEPDGADPDARQAQAGLSVDPKTGKADMTSFMAEGEVPLALVGVVPAKASAENGAILPGDLLVTSATPGHCMKAGPNPPQGSVIGKALSGLDSGTGTIKLLVTLQ
jgi:hypothetical protein